MSHETPPVRRPPVTDAVVRGLEELARQATAMAPGDDRLIRGLAYVDALARWYRATRGPEVTRPK